MSTREASQNMERLARLVEQLSASVEAFKLRENQAYLAPASNVNVTMENEPELTFSGVFRTVSAAAQPAQLSSVGSSSMLSPAWSNDSFPSYPMTPQQSSPVGTPTSSPQRSYGVPPKRENNAR